MLVRVRLGSRLASPLRSHRSASVAIAEPPPAAAAPPRRAHRGLTSLTVGGFDVDAVSIGGLETCLCIPAFKLCFDIGRCPQRACALETLLLTHCHLDHVGGLGAYVATRSLLGASLPTVYVPEQRVAAVEAYLAAVRALEDSASPCSVLPTSVGESFALNGGRHRAVPFFTAHPVPCNGYALHSVRQKLKAEYAGLAGAEIARLRAEGRTVSDTILVPEVAFTGDTAASWVHHPSAAASGALAAKLLIMECTFVDEAVSAEDAREFGHTHLDEIVEHAELFAGVGAILLVHFSARYKRAEIEAALAQKLPPRLRSKVTPLLEGYA